jgi:hypothetical protein
MIQDAAHLAGIGCSPEPGEDNAEWLGRSGASGQNRAVSILFQKSNPKGQHEMAKAMSSGECSQNGDGERDSGKIRVVLPRNRTHVP